MPLANTTATPEELKRLAWFIAISLVFHVVILIVTSLPFILRGFKPAEAAHPPAAAAAPAATPAKPAATRGEAPKSGDAAAPAGTAVPAAGKPKDPDAEYGKDKTASPDELKSGGPSIDSELGK